MKIRYTLTVDVDPQEWLSAGGEGQTPTEIRADIQSYLRTNILGGDVFPLLDEAGASIDEANTRTS